MEASPNESLGTGDSTTLDMMLIGLRLQGGQPQSASSQLRHHAIWAAEVSCAHENKNGLAGRLHEVADGWQA